VKKRGVVVPTDGGPTMIVVFCPAMKVIEPALSTVVVSRTNVITWLTGRTLTNVESPRPWRRS
jgi:hypothetical protein